jgi:hypothetical protein
VLRIEVNLQTYRVAHQDDLTAEEYKDLMMDGTEDLPKNRFNALQEIEKEKIKVAKAYNKRVHEKLFQVGDLVWKTILPLGSRNVKYGKWSPSWEGPFKVTRIVPGNSYFVE